MKPCLTALSRFVCVFAFLLLFNVLNYHQSAVADGPASSPDSPASNISQIAALTPDSPTNDAPNTNKDTANATDTNATADTNTATTTATTPTQQPLTSTQQPLTKQPPTPPKTTTEADIKKQPQNTKPSAETSAEPKPDPKQEPEEKLKPISPYSKVNHNPIINTKNQSDTKIVSIIKPEDEKDKYDVLEPVKDDEVAKKRPPCRAVKREKQDMKDYDTRANEGRKYIDGSDAVMLPEKHSDDEPEYEDCEPESIIAAALPENTKESQILGDGTLVNKPILASSNQVISGFSIDLSGGVSAYQLGGNTFSGLGNESISYYRYIEDWYLEASLEASQFIGGSSQFISQGIGGSVGHKFEVNNVMIVPFFGVSVSGTIRVANGIYDGAYFGTSATIGMSVKPKESIFGWSTSLSSGYFTINNYALNNMATINYRNSLLIQPKDLPVLFNISVAFMSGFRHGGGDNAFAEYLTGGISFKL